MKTEELRKAGLKATAPRLKILHILQQTQVQHLSAEDIHKQLAAAGEDIGLATVYRVLTQFEEADLVTRHYFEGGISVFEFNQGKHHDHLVCVKCGFIEEFVDEFIEKQQKIIAQHAGFSMTSHALNLYGICRTCQEKL